jgi:transglutaminase-like putative cysteine protease
MSSTASHPICRAAPRSGFVRVIVALIVWASHPAAGYAIDDYERWYILELGTDRAGWAVSSQRTDGERITTRAETRIEIKRGNVALAVSAEAVFIETADHRPVSMRVVQRLGAAPTTLDATYEADAIHVVLTGPGRTERRKLPLPEGQWLTPAAAADYVRQRLAAMPERIVVRTIELGGGGLDPLAPLTPVLVTRSRLEPATIEVGGRQVSGVRCVTVSSSQPSVEASEVVDAQGVPIRSEVAMGPWRIVMTTSERGAARARIEAPEVMLRTFVRPDRPIPEPRLARRLVLRLWADDGPVPPIPPTGVQHVEVLGGGAARVTIDLNAPTTAEAADAADRAFLDPSSMLNSDDDAVLALTRRGAGDVTDPARRAENMRRFVHGYIRAKGLDVGFGSAAETARTRTGDCTEHATLLAAMLRADGIPSRVASGLIYAEVFEGAEGIFAYHMWAQALLPIGNENGARRWVDLDATLPAETPFDATHVALAVSALADGRTESVFMALVSALGRLRASIESVSTGSR